MDIPAKSTVMMLDGMTRRVPNSNTEWKKWGERDPLWAVASWPRKEKNGTDPWSDEDFYKNGEADWADFLNHWQRYGVDSHACLEIGCGAGRITMHLAKFFKKTCAVDVSKHMLICAQEHIRNPNADFILTDGVNLPTRDNSVTAVFSAHVFQHFDNLSVTSG